MYEDAIAVVVFVCTVSTVQASLQQLLHAAPEMDCRDHQCSAVVKCLEKLQRPT